MVTGSYLLTDVCLQVLVNNSVNMAKQLHYSKIH